jgi:clostripain
MTLPAYGQVENNWTIMHYAVGSNSSEIDLLDDMQEMKTGKTSEGYEVITLIDRTAGYSEDSIALGANFTDTRLYRFDGGTYEELDGGEILSSISMTSNEDLNMGDAHVLKNFIQFCKTNYPAKHYMLVLRSHGNGMGMCPDEESGVMDRLYPGELQNVLSGKESVDILGLDVCSMAGLENLYEWRPNKENRFAADYVIASAPLSGAWAYDQILNRLQISKNSNVDLDDNHFSPGKEKILNPSIMTPREFGEMIMEEIFDNQPWASWGLFDNRHIFQAKNEIDKLAKLLSTESKNVIKDILTKALAYHHNTSDDILIAQLTFPYTDAYDFYRLIAQSKELRANTRSKAGDVLDIIDDLVLSSFYGQGFLPTTENFTEGKSGVYQILPLGHLVFSPTNGSFWSHTTWFHPHDKSNENHSYGQYDWCSDGAVEGNQKVDNFFEFLDALFDDSNDESGGVNKYRW